MKGRRAFRSIQNAQPPAGSSTDVEQPSTRPDALGDPIHSLRNVGNLGGDRGNNLGVFSINYDKGLDRG